MQHRHRLRTRSPSVAHRRWLGPLQYLSLSLALHRMRRSCMALLGTRPKMGRFGTWRKLACILVPKLRIPHGFAACVFGCHRLHLKTHWIWASFWSFRCISHTIRVPVKRIKPLRGWLSQVAQYFLNKRLGMWTAVLVAQPLCSQSYYCCV